MTSLILLLAVGAFLGGAILLLKGMGARRLRSVRVSRNILSQRLAPKPQPVPVASIPSPAQDKQRNLLPQLTRLLTRTRFRPFLMHLDQALHQAKIPLKPAEFLYLSTASLFLALLAVQLTTNNVWLMLLFALAASYLPFYYLRIAQALRLRKIEVQVADSLLLITNSLRAGSSFLDAMDAAARELPAPINDEFNRALHDISLGIPVDEAFTKMSVRCRNEDLDLAVTAFKIQREIGGNLAEILEHIAATIRERVKLKQEIRTLSTQGKLSGAILTGMPLAMILMLQTINPSYLKLLFTTPEGRAMLFVGGVMQFAGFLLIRRIIKIEV